MVLFPIDLIEVNRPKIEEIKQKIKSIYRLITYSRHHVADDLLDSFLQSLHNLQELLGLKNAQMESQSEEELLEYQVNLQTSLNFVVDEINGDLNFETELQLFQLLRLISPEAHAQHPNRYRQTLVQIGGHCCPEPEEVPALVSELFYQMQHIPNPIVRAIYFHHELIRIHPFADGNGRVTRIAKNWMLMYKLYPPIFINDAPQKREYIQTLSCSFRELALAPTVWNPYTAAFFEQELDRLLVNANHLYNAIYQTGLNRAGVKLGN